MKKKIFLFFLVAIVGVAFLSIGSFKAEAGPIKLTYSNFFPPAHFNGSLGASWAKEIEKRSNGRVKITYFPGGALLKGGDMYDGILKGITDIGMSCFAYTRGRFPAMEALDLPMGYTSGYAATMVANDFYKKFKPEELSKTKVMYIHAHGPGLLHSKKPVYKLEEVKGLKVRATGLSAKVVTALGGAPVGMPQGGTYEALQKGVVEATFSPMEVLKGWKQGEVIKSTTECYSVGYTTAMYVMMNMKTWNSLPKDIQKIIEEVSAEWLVKHAAGWDEADKAGREFSLSLGNKIIPLSEEESARWAGAVAPVFDDYVKTAKGMGLPGDAYLDFIRKGIKKYSKK